MKPGNPRTTIGIIFDKGNLGRDNVFITPKINDPVPSLVTTTSATNADLP
jgi:hypothetical protein